MFLALKAICHETLLKYIHSFWWRVFITQEDKTYYTVKILFGRSRLSYYFVFLICPPLILFIFPFPHSLPIPALSFPFILSSFHSLHHHHHPHFILVFTNQNKVTLQVAFTEILKNKCVFKPGLLGTIHFISWETLIPWVREVWEML